MKVSSRSDLSCGTGVCSGVGGGDRGYAGGGIGGGGGGAADGVGQSSKK